MKRVGLAADILQEGSLYLLLWWLPISKAAISITIALLVVGWLLKQLPTGWRTSVWRRRSARSCVIALGVFLGACALSIPLSSHRRLSLRGFVGKTAKFALLFLVAADVAHTGAVLLRRRHHGGSLAGASPPRVAGIAETENRRVLLRRCVLIISLSALVVGLDALAQELFRKDPIYGYPLSIYSRMTGPYENPGDLATYLMVVLPMIFAQTIGSRAPWQWGLGSLGVLLLGCLIRTQAAGAWLGLLGGLFMVLLVRWRPRKVVLASGLGALVLAGFLLQIDGHVREMLLRLLAHHGSGVHDRLFMWQTSWKMIQDRPLVGQGLNTFMANYLHYWVGGEQQPRYAHNCFLQTAAETGLLGLAAFAWLLGTLVWVWWRASSIMSRQHPSRAVWIGLGIGLVGFLIQSAFDTNFYSMRQATLFWALSGVATGLALSAIQQDVEAGHTSS